MILLLPYSIFVSVLMLAADSKAIPADTIADRHSVVLPVSSGERSALARWQNITSIEDVLNAYPARARSLLAALNLEHPGLGAVKAAVQAGDTASACRSLLAYYEKRAGSDAPLPDIGQDEAYEQDVISEAQRLLSDTVTFGGVKARVPRLNDGGWDWNYTGPNDDQEFGYKLNGHQYLLSLFISWKSSGNEHYVKTFDSIIRDWIIHNPPPPESDSIYMVLNGQGHKLDYRDIGELRWRTLETGNRLGVSWPQTFYGFQGSKAFTPAARLLMLANIFEQAEYLKQYHKEGHNWTTMEMNGLALTGLIFPEFKSAESWAGYALEVMKNEIFRQVYPDGVQKELSTKTQWVALRRFESVADHFRRAGREIPDNYFMRLEEMYNYLAYAMRPDGHQPLNNDSDREDLRPIVMRAAKIFSRPDWIWVATNGKQGRRPDGLPSVAFPWAGIHILRNGWDENAHWAFFDTGPFGTGHQHADKLHLSVAAYGRDLLVDGGRYTHEDYFSFDPKIWRGYFRSSFSHNVILVDGKGQKGGPVTTEEPLREGTDYLYTKEFVYSRGTFSSGYDGLKGNAVHTRALMYVRDKYWIVVDRIGTDQPRNVQVLWHYAPSCTVDIENGTAVSTNYNEGNLRIVPVGKTDWKIDLIKGQTEPFVQGWYSATYGNKTQNPTVAFNSQIAKKTVFAWVLIPARGEVHAVDADIVSETQNGVSISIKSPGEKTLVVTIPLEDGSPEIE